jgi:hypothetical protein
MKVAETAEDFKKLKQMEGQKMKRQRRPSAESLATQ